MWWVRCLAMGWTVQGLNAGAGLIFCTHPDQPRAHPTPCIMGTGSLSWRCGIDHPPPARTKVKERVELHLYSPSGPSRPVLR